MSAEAFIAAARELKGAKWRHHARSAVAVDCIGLLAVSFLRAGIPFDDEFGYSREPVGDLLRAGAIKRWGDSLPRDQAKPADIALLRWGKAPPSHVGIIADHPDGGLSIIHANNLHGVVEQGYSGMPYAATTDIFRWVDHVA